MTNSLYLDIAKQGKNTWKSYLILIPLTSFLTFVVISTFTGMSLSEINSTTSDYPIQTKSILTIMIPKLIVIGIFFSVLFQHFHQRKIFTIINLEGFIRWKRILFSLVLWFILQIPRYIISFFLDSSRFSLKFELQQWLSITPFAILIIIFLSSFISCTVLGYIFQGSSLLISKPKYLIPLLGVIFSLINTNSDLFLWIQDFIFNFLDYSFLLLIIFKDNSLEFIIGISLANSFIAQFLIGINDNIFNLSPIINISNPYNWALNFLFLLLNYVIFYLICDQKLKWRR